MKDLNVILLAGGSSSRFAPLREKNLYKFLGESLVERQVKKFASLGINTLTIITNENNNSEIKSEAEKHSDEVRVLVQVGDGQAGAVQTAIKDIDEGDVLIVNMNDVFDDTLLSSFKEKYDSLRSDNHNLLTGYEVKDYFPGGYLVLDGENVVEVIEKPGKGNEPSNLVRLVFDYFSNVNELRQNINNAKTDEDDKYEVALTDMMNRGEVFKLLSYSDNWNTIKYPWHVLSTMDYFLSSIKGQNISDDAEISDGAIINGDVVIEEGVKIFDGAIINGPAYIGKDSIIGNHSLIRNSMIGDNCVIGGSEVVRSYFAEKVWLHKNYVGDSIIESNVSFGSNAITANFRLDESNVKVNVKGKSVDSGRSKLGTIIGSDVRVGVNVSIMPGVKIGSNSSVGPNVLLGDDVEDSKFVRVRQNLEIRDNTLDISSLDREKHKRKL